MGIYLGNLQNIYVLFKGTGFGTTGGTTTGFGFGATPQQQTQQPATGFSFGQTNTAFQLQNPPAGNKRGKKS